MKYVVLFLLCFVKFSFFSGLGMLGAQSANELFLLTYALAYALNDDEQMSFQDKVEVLLREFKAAVVTNKEAIRKIENWTCEYFFFSGMMADFSYKKITAKSPEDFELKKIFNELGTWNFWLQGVNNIFLDVEEQDKTNRLSESIKKCFDETIGCFTDGEKRQKLRENIEDKHCLEKNTLSDGFLFVCQLSDFLKKVEKALQPGICTIL